MTFATDQNLDRAGLSALSLKLLSLREAVFVIWERNTRSQVAGADALRTPILIDTLPAFYDNIAEALTPDYPRPNATSNTDIASVHGNERARMTGYGPEQVIHEYQLLRDAILQVLEQEAVPLDRAQWQIVQQSIDSAVREAVKTLTTMHDSLRHRVAAALSHDMRTPLAAMVQGGQLISLDPASEHTRRTALRIVEHGERLGEMVGELLEAMSFTQGDSLPLVLSQVDLYALAGTVCRQLDAIAPGRFVLTGHSVVGYWCANSMRRALENVATNALKYGDDGTIRIHLAETRERALLSVHNSGNPIASESRARIFEYLRQEEGDQSGWGIGLPFVRKVAESHGGSVLVDSAESSGTTFTIDVPLDCRPFVQPPACLPAGPGTVAQLPGPA